MTYNPYAPYGKAYMLNCDNRLNVKTPLKNEFVDDDAQQSVEFIKNTKNSRIYAVGTYGDPAPIGTTYTLIADQSGRRFGYGTVVGTMTFDGEGGFTPAGEVASAPFYVFK